MNGRPLIALQQLCCNAKKYEIARPLRPLTAPSPFPLYLHIMDGTISQAFHADATDGAFSGTAGASRHEWRMAKIAAEARIGIDATTGLASDFLNQFTEVAMMLDVIASDPSCIDDLDDWRARDYAAHFMASGFSDRHLALEAYELSPPLTRRRFDASCIELADILAQGLAFLASCRDAGADAAIRPAAQALGAEVREHLYRLDTLVHAGRKRPSQSQVGALFSRRRI